MLGNPLRHKAQTETLARALSPADVYNWLCKYGYFPESYVLPPCFEVTNFYPHGKPWFGKAPKSYKPDIAQLTAINFPKSELTDRSFGIVDPALHADMAYWIVEHWDDILGVIFHKDNKVCSYSFPVPVDAKTIGSIGMLRSGRLIYEFLEMAEHDLASVAYAFDVVIRTDIKNFYPSIYTHSISWAIHTKATIRTGSNRFDFSFVGNRLDKLFQNSNDGCTNGIAIGPAVSDIISEVILASVDRMLSSSYSKNDAIVVRFKDDYRILCKDEAKGRQIIKKLQAALKEFNLELNETKTQQFKLPEGLFREWRSRYHAVNPNPKDYYSYERFKETYLAVLTIDRDCPGTGVIDRFLVDIVNYRKQPNFDHGPRNISRVISMLLMLGRLRIKAFPKVLAILEMILKTKGGPACTAAICEHMDRMLRELAKSEQENHYLIMWILYFVRANDLPCSSLRKLSFSNPLLKAVKSSRWTLYAHRTGFTIFTPVKRAAKKVDLLTHLDVFNPQDGI